MLEAFFYNDACLGARHDPADNRGRQSQKRDQVEVVPEERSHIYHHRDRNEEDELNQESPRHTKHQMDYRPLAALRTIGGHT